VDFNNPDKSVKNIKIVFFLNLFFSIFEVVFGLLFNSMAILSDAIHDFGDSISVGLSWLFQRYSRKEPSNRFSFGHQRFSLMGALITSVVLLVGSVLLFARSIPRLLAPEEVNAEGMLLISVLAIAMNGYAAWLLSRGTSQNEKVLNVHMLEDVLGWAGVLVVSIVVRYTQWYILDPILSLLIAAFIFVKTLPLFISTMHIFLEGVPSHVDLDRLEEDILKIHDVHAVTHLHIWSIDGEENALNATLFVTTDNQRRIEDIKEKVRFLTTELRVSHSTIEIISDPEKIVKQEKGQK
jgi:cobalt-zinc-cadmium efflux system protein